MQDILFVTVALKGGGAERVMVTLANYLSKRGYNIKILLLISNEIIYPLEKDIEIIYSNRKTNPFKQIQEIRKHSKRLNEGVVVSFFTHQNLYTIIANLCLKNRIVVSERNDPAKTVRNKWIAKLRNFLYRKCDKIVFQTEDAKKFFPVSVQKKGEIISNPLKSNLPEPYTGERKKKLVAFSRLTKQKNIFMMLDACKDVFKEYKDYNLEIFGEGELHQQLKEYADSLGIGNAVIFRGFSNNIHEEIVDASAFLISSDYEGLSNSMLEAMGCGLPCICTDCPIGGAKTFIINYQNGILTPVGNKEEFAKAICKVLGDKKLAERLGRNAVKIRDILDETRICEHWEQVLTNKNARKKHDPE